MMAGGDDPTTSRFYDALTFGTPQMVISEGFYDQVMSTNVELQNGIVVVVIVVDDDDDDDDNDDDDVVIVVVLVVAMSNCNE